MGANLVVGILLGQLELSTIGLVNLLDTGLVVGGAVGAYTVVERTAASHDINLMVHDVVPDGREVLHQLRLAGLGIEVCYAGIEVVGTDGMAHCLVLVAELMAVLVMVFAVLH